MNANDIVYGVSLNEPAVRQADAIEQDREQMDRLNQRLEAARLVRTKNDREIEELETQIRILTNRQLPKIRLALKTIRKRSKPLRKWPNNSLKLEALREQLRPLRRKRSFNSREYENSTA